MDQREQFWTALLEFAGVLHTPGTAPVLQHRDRMPGAVWFEDTRLNFAENLLARDDDHVALVFGNERGARRELTYRELRAEVGRVAAGLRELGIGPGDRVAGFLPNLPETVIAMLATTSLGAAWTSCSPDFGINGVLDRFGQVAPRVLFTADGYFYNGKTLDSLAPVRGVLEQLPSVERVVVVPVRGGSARPRRPAARGALRRIRPRRRGARSSRGCRSTRRCSSCTRRARPACRSASCTASAARCCSTARSTCCTRT